jgi:hypothetical protein
VQGLRGILACRVRRVERLLRVRLELLRRRIRGFRVRIGQRSAVVAADTRPRRRFDVSVELVLRLLKVIGQLGDGLSRQRQDLRQVVDGRPVLLPRTLEGLGRLTVPSGVVDKTVDRFEKVLSLTSGPGQVVRPAWPDY